MPSQLPRPSAGAAANGHAATGAGAVNSRALGPARIVTAQQLSKAAAAAGNIYVNGGGADDDRVWSANPRAVRQSAVTAEKAGLYLRDRDAAGDGGDGDGRLYRAGVGGREACPTEALVVSPRLHLPFTGPFHHRSRSTLVLTNGSDALRIAYRVKSTAPKGRLVVKPGRGIVEPKQVVEVEFVLSPVTTSAQPLRCPPPHRVLLEAAVVERNTADLDAVFAPSAAGKAKGGKDFRLGARGRRIMIRKLEMIYNMQMLPPTPQTAGPGQHGCPQEGMLQPHMHQQHQAVNGDWPGHEQQQQQQQPVSNGGGQWPQHNGEALAQQQQQQQDWNHQQTAVPQQQPEQAWGQANGCQQQEQAWGQANGCQQQEQAWGQANGCHQQEQAWGQDNPAQQAGWDVNNAQSAQQQQPQPQEQWGQQQEQWGQPQDQANQHQQQQPGDEWNHHQQQGWGGNDQAAATDNNQADSGWNANAGGGGGGDNWGDNVNTGGGGDSWGAGGGWGDSGGGATANGSSNNDAGGGDGWGAAQANAGGWGEDNSSSAAKESSSSSSSSLPAGPMSIKDLFMVFALVLLLGIIIGMILSVR